MLSLRTLGAFSPVLLIVFLFAGVSGNGQPPSPSATASAPPPNLSNPFTFRLFQELATASPIDSNLLVCPLSAAYALTMTYNGAAGETRQAMADALGVGNFSLDEVNRRYQELISRLTTSDKAVTVAIANSFWHRTGVTVRPDFIDRARTHFQATVRELDFGAPGAADTINAWVATNTQNRIKRVIDAPIDRDIVTYLINAVYFKGTWTTPFDPKLTRDAAFFRADGSQVSCRMMQQAANLGYVEDSLCQGVNLPYGDGSTSMLILLPRPGKTVADLIKTLDEARWNQTVSALWTVHTILQLPRFSFADDHGLNQTLKTMGMSIAFTPQADFSNMVSGTSIWIDTVIHKTFIQVNEQGTEAAGATVVAHSKSMSLSITVDRPFLFAIWEKQSNAILFLGQVAEPVWME
jgi:serine protease inhibitor